MALLAVWNNLALCVCARQRVWGRQSFQGRIFGR